MLKLAIGAIILLIVGIVGFVLSLIFPMTIVDYFFGIFFTLLLAMLAYALGELVLGIFE